MFLIGKGLLLGYDLIYMTSLRQYPHEIVRFRQWCPWNTTQCCLDLQTISLYFL